MRKILLALSIVFLASSCVYHRHPGLVVHGNHPRYKHVHGHACGHVFLNGVWVVVR